jgi:hypothetical protein
MFVFLLLRLLQGAVRGLKSPTAAGIYAGVHIGVDFSRVCMSKLTLL